MEENLINFFESIDKGNYHFNINKRIIIINKSKNDTSIKIENNKEIENTILNLFENIKKEFFQEGIKELFEIDQNRISHIYSVLILLKIFYQNYDRNKVNINKELVSVYNDGIKENENKQFEFAALLLALCHDLGYKYEQENYDYRNNLHFYAKIENFISELREMNKFIPSYLNSNVFQSYFNYMKMKEHGICGGLDFWKKMSILKSKHQNDERYPERLYKYIALQIMCHNIWFCYDDKITNVEEFNQKKQIYINYGLKDLIIEPKKPGESDNFKIKQEINPMLFLFILVDTIDPIKFALKNKVVDMEVTFSFENNILEITTNNLNYEKIIEDLNNWLLPVIKINCACRILYEN